MAYGHELESCRVPEAPDTEFNGGVGPAWRCVKEIDYRWAWSAGYASHASCEIDGLRPVRPRRSRYRLRPVALFSMKAKPYPGLSYAPDTLRRSCRQQAAASDEQVGQGSMSSPAGSDAP